MSSLIFKKIRKHSKFRTQKKGKKEGTLTPFVVAYFSPIIFKYIWKCTQLKRDGRWEKDGSNEGENQRKSWRVSGCEVKGKTKKNNKTMPRIGLKVKSFGWLHIALLFCWLFLLLLVREWRSEDASTAKTKKKRPLEIGHHFVLF